jgi:hypothetical protein
MIWGGRAIDEAGVEAWAGRQLIGGRYPDAVFLIQVSLFDQDGLSAEGTFPGIVPEPGIDFMLEKSFARQTLHGTPAAGAAQFLFISSEMF